MLLLLLNHVVIVV